MTEAPLPLSIRFSRGLAYLGRPAPWFLAAFVIRFLYFREQAASSPLFYQPLLDEAELVETARGVLAGNGFGPEPLFKAPLYPLFLAGVMAATGPDYLWVVRLIQHLAGTLLVLLGFDAARRLSGSGGGGERAGALAAAALAFYGPLIRLEDRLILDFWTVFLQSAMLWALVRTVTAAGRRRKRLWTLLAGMLAALSWLNRPTILPVLPFLALWLAGYGNPLRFFRRDSAKPAAGFRRRIWCAVIFLLPPVLAVAAFGLRNAVIGRETLFMPWQGGYNFYQANRRDANGRYLTQRAFSLNLTGNPTRELMIEGYREAAHSPDGGKLAVRPGKINAYWYGLARREITEAPLRWIGLMVRKTFYLFSAREIFNFEDFGVQRELSSVLPFAPIGFGFLWPFALAAPATLLFLPRQRRRLHGLFWLYSVLVGAAIAFFFAGGRFRMPLAFPAAVLAASGLATFGNRLLRAARAVQPGFPRSRLNLVVSLYSTLFLAGIILSWADWWGVRSENVRHFEYARLSSAFWRNGEHQKALEFADRCERESPGYPTVPLLRGQALYALERFNEAAGAFEESLRRLESDPVAPFNLGVIEYYHRNRSEAALRHFQESLRRQPAYDRAAWMAARACLRLGDAAEARNRLAPYLRNPSEKQRTERDFLISAILLLLREKDRPPLLSELQEELGRRFGESGREELRSEMEKMGWKE